MQIVYPAAVYRLLDAIVVILFINVLFISSVKTRFSGVCYFRVFFIFKR